VRRLGGRPPRQWTLPELQGEIARLSERGVGPNTSPVLASLLALQKARLRGWMTAVQAFPGRGAVAEKVYMVNGAGELTIAPLEEMEMLLDGPLREGSKPPGALAVSPAPSYQPLREGRATARTVWKGTELPEGTIAVLPSRQVVVVVPEVIRLGYIPLPVFAGKSDGEIVRELLQMAGHEAHLSRVTKALGGEGLYAPKEPGKRGRGRGRPLPQAGLPPATPPQEALVRTRRRSRPSLGRATAD
jgi:hypothetical protein